MKDENLIDQVDQLLALTLLPGDRHKIIETATHCYQGALTLVSFVHGSQSQQARLLFDIGELRTRGSPEVVAKLWPVVRGSLLSLREEIKAGSVGTVELRGAGASLGDLLSLADEALSQKDREGEKIAAVLTAAAFEDTIRRMGVAFAGVSDRPKLQEVLTSLQTAGVLQGAAFTTAQSYLRFRNAALHADWTAIDRSVVRSCCAFVESLLQKHFSS